MFSVYLAIILVVLLIAFVAAWRLMPAGWLTAMTGTLSAAAIALYEAMGDLMPELKSLLPADYRAWLVIVFLLLTVAARFRNRAARK
jgi:hypothetical protein